MRKLGCVDICFRETVRDVVIKDDKLYIFDAISKHSYEIDLKERANYCEQMDITELLKYIHMIQNSTITLEVYG